MVDFEVLGTDKELSTDDPVGSAMNLGTIILGAAALFVALPVGQQISGWVMNKVAEMAGTEVGDANPGMTFGGD